MKKINFNKKTQKSSLFYILGTVLTVYSFIMILLLVWALITALKFPSGHFNEFRDREFSFLEGAPWEWAWSNFSTVFKYLKVDIYIDTDIGTIQTTRNVFQMLGNTLIYTLGGSFVSMIVPCLVAYATSITKFKFNKVIDTVVWVVIIIPIIGSGPAEIEMMLRLGLYDTWAGFLIQKSYFVTIYYMIFQAAFKSLPYSLVESAYLDGANDYRVMFNIMLPLVKNLMLTVILILFITFWNDYNYPLIYLRTKPTLAYGVYYLFHINHENVIENEPMKLAGSMILFTPILILFACFKDKLMSNLSMGGVKE